MADKHPALTFHSMPVGASYARPEQVYPEGLGIDSPAAQAMTDLRAVTALTVERTNTLAATRERMRKLGVRMLLVTGATGAVMGVVTVTDLVFPWFLFIVGVALPFSMHYGRGAQLSAPRKLLAALRRGLIIYTLGLILDAASAGLTPGSSPGERRRSVRRRRTPGRRRSRTAPGRRP